MQQLHDTPLRHLASRPIARVTSFVTSQVRRLTAVRGGQQPDGDDDAAGAADQARARGGH
jgi:hypothetical protein